jgi:hypothetical protein
MATEKNLNIMFLALEGQPEWRKAIELEGEAKEENDPQKARELYNQSATGLEGLYESYTNHRHHNRYERIVTADKIVTLFFKAEGWEKCSSKATKYLNFERSEPLHGVQGGSDPLEFHLVHIRNIGLQARLKQEEGKKLS